MSLINMKRIAWFTSFLIATACGTEGGNPHRNDKEPQNSQRESDRGTSQAGTEPKQDATEPNPSKAFAAACDFNIELAPSTESGGSGQFLFVFNAADSTETRSSTGTPLVAQATLTLVIPDPSGGASREETKPIGDWQPAPGTWKLAVTLTDPNGIDQVKSYCTGTLTLGDGVTSATRFSITVNGIKKPTQ